MQSVTSQDSTKIAYDKIGSGPAVILVDGATGARSFGYSANLAALLSDKLTVYYYDRRGRGDSGDNKPYALDREIEDVAALIDDAGGHASLYGISSGGALALEAAIKLGDKVRKLAVYEIPYDDSEDGIKRWRDYRKKLKKILVAEKRGEAIELFMSFVGVPSVMIDGIRKSPMWQPLESIALTLEYDAEALGDDRTVPVNRARKITAKSLVMDGGASLQIMPFMRATADKLAKSIPGAERKTVESQSHDVDSKVLAPILIEFFTS